MIRLLSLTIENFRSIIKTPLEVHFENYTVLAGENNSGKSNILRALNLFFNGVVDGLPYEPNIDFPKNKTDLQSSSKTKITVTLTYDKSKEGMIDRAITVIEKNTQQGRLDDNQVKLRLSYSRKGISSWQFIGKKGARSINSEYIDKVVQAVQNSVRFKYLPVGREILPLIENELNEELFQTLFSGFSGVTEYRRNINTAIDTLITALEPKLGEGSEGITKEMQEVFQGIKSFGLKLPFNSLESLIPKLSLVIHDKYETGIESKGAGIQTSSLLFVMKYIADHYPQRHNAVKTYIWAIEEPESFLHPTKQREMANIISDFSSEIQTIVSTHNPHFIRNNSSNIYVVGKSLNSPYSTEVIDNNWETAKSMLGVSLLDSLHLWPINIVTEGISDEIILSDFFEKWHESEPEKVAPPYTIRIHPATNCTSACSMFEQYFFESKDEEIDLYLVLDGDEAGKKALRGLLKRSSKNGISFSSNKDYFVLNGDIELYFPVEILEEAVNQMPSTVEIIRDVEDKIIDFKIKDGNKGRVAKFLTKKASISDYNRLKTIFKKTSIYKE